VVLFSVVAVAPAILVAVFSIMFFNIGLEAWFSSRVRTALDESITVAQTYVEEHRQAIANDVRAMAAFFDNVDEHILYNDELLTRLLATQAEVRDLSEAVVFNRSGTILARTGYTYSLQFEEVPRKALREADVSEVPVLTTDNEDRVRALVKLSGPFNTYLYAGRFVDATVVAHADRIQQAVSQYRLLEGRRSELQITFSLIFMVVALLLLLAAVWFGLLLATRLARPIVSLIDAAEQMGAGNLDVRVELRPGSDEVGTLVRAFNRMAVQLSIQQQALLEANLELDERRRFTETVLSGVTAGVIGMDDAGNIHLPNPSASELLACNLETLVGRPAVEAWPELAELVEQVRHRPDRLLEAEIHCVREGRARIFLVRLAAERLGERVIGYVLTFDDITELQSAQRKAAWADIARRIAHEIKNPLTPIQLSAERLKRKYLRQIDTDPETFATCTDTIVRQVDDIRRMVNEFSEFARMPNPALVEEDLRIRVADALVLQRTAFPTIAFTADLPDQPVIVRCDGGQIGRALTNLLKNAVEAIEGRKGRAGQNLPSGRVTARIVQTGRHIAVVVIDNGRGLPIENRDRLTEPYMTTRAKGTGLGLAIVKKIMEDHGGTLVLEDAEKEGAQASLIFPGPGEAGTGVAGESRAFHGL
ncbi:MAG: two-component system NtrC family nitrogen regulation sensor histidine kinase NtrY, partial [Rhodospirillaceae bacterium]